MANEGLEILPFYSLSDSQLNNFLRLDHQDILFQNNILSDYLRNIDCVSLLDELNFGYVTDLEFNNKVQSLVSRIELSVLHLNIRSLNCNHLALCQFLELLVVKFDVIVLSEIWVTNIDCYHNIIPGYSFHYDLPKDSRVGGVGMFINNNFTQTVIFDYKIQNCPENQVENIWLMITKNGKSYIVAGIYRHPNQNHSEFTSSMENVLGKISNQDLPCIIAGDLNIDLSKCDSNKSTAEYVDNLLTNNFMPVIVMPTQITSHSVFLIDHIYYFESPKNKHTLQVKSGNFLEDISDHLQHVGPMCSCSTGSDSTSTLQHTRVATCWT